MKPNILFFGTHDFAASILKELLELDVCHITAIITQPDKPVGRKQIMEAPPVKKIAQLLHAHAQLLQPVSLRKKDILLQLAAYHADFFVVVAYGNIIPPPVIALAPHGVINVHPSLLPLYRGPSPIQQALMDGRATTGTTIMLIDEEVDHGPILLKRECVIKQNDTFPTLCATLATLSAQALIAALEGYATGTLKPYEQEHAAATYTKLLAREDGRIDWLRSADEIYNQWRGLLPWPGVFTQLHKKHFVSRDGKRIKLLTIAKTQQPSQPHPPGTVLTSKGHVYVATGTELLELITVQIEGKKPLNAAQFINGILKA